MKRLKLYIPELKKFMISLIIIITPVTLSAQQKITIGIHADPVISWFGSDIKETKNQGARPGFDFGITYNKYFTSNYSFSTGISLVSAGGRLVSSDTTVMEFAHSTFKTATVLPNESVVYKIRYLAIPLGLKLQTNQIGYITYFTDLGLDPKVVVGAKTDIPSLKITGEKAGSEVRMFNISYHITAGFEYSLGGSTALVAGLNFDNNFVDITRDNGRQLKDKVTHKLFSFRFGVIF